MYDRKCNTQQFIRDNWQEFIVYIHFYMNPTVVHGWITVAVGGIPSTNKNLNVSRYPPVPDSEGSGLCT